MKNWHALTLSFLLSHAEPLVAQAEKTRLFLFRFPDDRECVAAWSTEGRRRAVLPRPPSSIVERDGEPSSGPADAEIELSPSVRYFRL